MLSSISLRLGLNSTMVRLQLGEEFQFQQKLGKSQFHYGSITTYTPKILKIGKMKSQFHYGSITTEAIVVANASVARSLNSTMVRLQLNLSARIVNGLWRSQFHYGSITTNVYKLDSGYRILSCLNSTMVRLQPYATKTIIRKACKRSQFHYGSITTLLEKAGFNSEVMGLNSTMVRLQPNLGNSNPVK